MAAKKKDGGGLRAALAAKQTRTEHYDIPLKSSEDVAAFAEKVNEAAQQKQVADFSSDDKVIARAGRDLASARAGLTGCFHRVVFRGLTNADFDTLVNEYPPTEEQAAGDSDLLWNPDTFPFALIAACIDDPDADLTAEEWQAELDSERWSRTERMSFTNAVFNANARDFTFGLPLG